MTEKWIFTFGCGQKYAGHYVKIAGTFSEARDKMCKKYGDKWAFQYSEEEWKSFESNPNRLYPLEVMLEELS